MIFREKHPITGEEFLDGAFSESKNTFYFSKNMTDSEKLAQNEEDYRSVIIHEIQHAVQAIEGFDGGDNSLDALEYMREKAREELGKRGDEEFKRLLWSSEEKLNAYLDDFIVKSWGVKNIGQAIYEMRKTKPGEAEAMDADERKYLTAYERRNKFPKYNKGVVMRDNFEEGFSGFSESGAARGIQRTEGERHYAKSYNPGRIGKNSDSGLVEGESTHRQRRQEGQGGLNDDRFDLADDWNKKINEFGTVPKGEKPARDIDVPNKIRRGRPISRFARTMMEAGVTPDDAISEFEQAILDGTMTHEVITDKRAEAKAVKEIKYEGFKESLEAWDVLVRKGKIGKEDNGFNGILRLW